MRKPLICLLFFLATHCSAQMPGNDAKEFNLIEKISCTPVKDQYLSSTCWSFASLSFLESELLKQGKEVLDLSEMFIARHSLVRKIHLHLKRKGQNYFTPGGQFHDVAWIIKNHGLVPESAYTGKQEGRVHHNHAALDTLLNHFVKKLVAQGVTEMNQEQEDYVNQTLDHYLGELPSTFEYNGSFYTPKSFAERVVALNPDDYVEITSYSHHPFYTSFVLEDKYNWTADSYYNVPLADFSRITEQSLNKGSSLCWVGDATDVGFSYYGGKALLPGGEDISQAARQNAFESKTTAMDHLMHIVGYGKDNSGRIWYYIKNSWGDYSNSLGGFMYMREDYFKMRTVAIIVNKSIIPAEIRQRLGI